MHGDFFFFLDKLISNDYLKGQITQLGNFAANFINKIKLKLLKFIQKQLEGN